MTVRNRPDPIADEILTLVAALAGGAGVGEAEVRFTHAGWREWYALVEVHGLAPGLSRVLGSSRWAGLPPELQARCRAQYLGQTARTLAALRQFREIRETLEPAGIPVIPLKGLAFAGALYADPGVRQFGDLDLLVPEAAGKRAVGLLKERGYTPAPAFTSAEEEFLHERQAHFCPLVRPGGMPVEVHTQVLKDCGDARSACAEAWGAARPGERGVLELDHTHAAVLAAAHYATHLRLGAGHLKWMVDLLLLLRGTPAADGGATLLSTAERWGLMATVAPLLAAATEFGGCPAMDLRSVPPVSARSLVYSPRDAGTRLLASAGSRLRRLGELPGSAARAHYLLRLLFPSPDHLRFRYGIPAGRPVHGYRLTHPFRLARRLIASCLRSHKTAAHTRSGRAVR